MIRQATRELERLESQGAPQLGLFAAAADADAQAEAAAERSGAFEALDALRDELAAIDPDSLTRAKRWTPLPSQEASAMNLDHPLPLLGNQSPNDFMRRYWQKKPC